MPGTLNVGGHNIITHSGTSGAGTVAADNIDTVNVGSNALVVDASGNIGIGTNSPSRPLEITSNGSASIGLSDTSTGGGTLAFNPPQNSNGFGQIDVGGANALRFNTNSQERMRIDSSGLVTKPYQQSFLARPSSNYFPSLGPGTLLSLGSVKHNVGNNFNSSTSTFTAPIDGKYLIGMLIRWNTGEYGSWNGAYLTSSVGTFYSITQPGYEIDNEITVVLNLSANDTIEYYSWSTNTSNRITIYSHAYAHLLG